MTFSLPVVEAVATMTMFRFTVSSFERCVQFCALFIVTIEAGREFFVAEVGLE